MWVKLINSSTNKEYEFPEDKYSCTYGYDNSLGGFILKVSALLSNDITTSLDDISIDFKVGTQLDAVLYSGSIPMKNVSVNFSKYVFANHLTPVGDNIVTDELHFNVE